MPNDSNTSNEAVNASSISPGEDDSATSTVGKRKPRQPKPGTETLQLLDFPSRLLNRLNHTAGYLEIDRLDFVVRIVEAALAELRVEEMQQKLKHGWSEWCDRHPRPANKSEEQPHADPKSES